MFKVSRIYRLPVCIRILIMCSTCMYLINIIIHVYTYTLYTCIKLHVIVDLLIVLFNLDIFFLSVGTR